MIQRGCDVFVKRRDVDDDRGTESLQNEWKALEAVAELGHASCFVRLYAAILDGDGIVRELHLENVPHGDCIHFVERNGPMKMEIAHKMCTDVRQALACLHTEKWAHNDVKPDNILHKVSSSGHFRFVLCDLEMTTSRFGAGDFYGTWHYMAPEMRFSRSSKRAEMDRAKADAWSFAATAIVLCTNVWDVDKTKCMMEDEGRLIVEHVRKTAPFLDSIVSSFVHVNPQERGDLVSSHVLWLDGQTGSTPRQKNRRASRTPPPFDNDSRKRKRRHILLDM